MFARVRKVARDRAGAVLVRLFRDEAGSQLVLIAFLMPALIGIAGLGTEGVLWFYTQQALQSAADSAAMSAGIEASKVTLADKADYSLEADAIAAQYGFVNGGNATVTVNWPPLGTCYFPGANYKSNYIGDPDAIEVVVTKPLTPALSALWLKGPLNICGRAVAVLNPNGGDCLLALDPTANNAIQASGSGSFTLTACGLFSDSDSSSAISTSGSAKITAPKGTVGTVGKYTSSGGSSISPTPTTGDASQANPYAGDPPVQVFDSYSPLATNSATAKPSGPLPNCSSSPTPASCILQFSSVPAWVNTQLQNPCSANCPLTIYDVTTSNAIQNGTTVSKVLTTTTVLLSAPVNNTVGNGDTIAIGWTPPLTTSTTLSPGVYNGITVNSSGVTATLGSGSTSVCGATPCYVINGNGGNKASLDVSGGSLITSCSSCNYIINGGNNGAISVSNNGPVNGTLTLGATTGNYILNGAVSLNGTVTLGSGIYVVNSIASNDTFQMNGGTLTGSGVTLVFTSSTDTYPNNWMNIGSSSSVNLTAPTTGQTAGFVLYGGTVDLNGKAVTAMPVGTGFQVSGSASLTFSGAIYLPEAALTLSGSGGLSSPCAQIIADTMNISGSGGLTYGCVAAGYNLKNPGATYQAQLVE